MYVSLCGIQDRPWRSLVKSIDRLLAYKEGEEADETYYKTNMCQFLMYFNVVVDKHEF